MLYTLYSILSTLLQFDWYYHAVQRAYIASYLTANVGAGLIEYGRQKASVIWPRNTPRGYIEEIIKLNDGHFL